uniref:Ig-like domain-containing protein n=1 Tax=Salarias fasciatus TaxID=181472 RepID=A0A672GAR5_SALFA
LIQVCLSLIFSYSLHLFFLFSLPGSEVIRKIVKEDQDALLSCSLDGTNIAEDVFDWRTDGSSGHEVFYYARGRSDIDRLPGQDDHFKDRVFHFPEQLAVGNASIVIRKTQVTDSGNYTCYFHFHEPRRRAQYELIVGEKPKKRKSGAAVFACFKYCVNSGNIKSLSNAINTSTKHLKQVLVP